ncbi:MAG: hypothetical protein ABW252_16290 [Polyangiales bacterium]
MLLSVVGLTSACDQPRPRCSVAPGDFAVRYQKIDGNCEGLVGDVLSLQVYYEPRSSKDMSPDLSNARIGVLPNALAGVAGHAAGRGTPDPSDDMVAFGTFITSKADDDDYCRIPTLTPARVRIPALTEFTDECGTLPAEPAVDELYEFSNFRAYNAPGAYGTQIIATLRYKTATCQGTYNVTGIYPSISCGTDAVVEDSGAGDAGVIVSMDGGLGDMDASLDATIPLDPDGGIILPQEEAPEEPTCPTPEEPGPEQIPDDGICGPGSGISPEFTATCDPVLLHCLIPNASSTP